MVFNKYTREAKLYPAIATLPPFILLYYFFIQHYLAGFINLILGLIIGGLTFSVGTIAFVFLLMEVNRFIAKFIIESRLFQNEPMMPTTNLLLYTDNTYSDDYKERIRKKIYADFGKKLLSRKDEAADESLARKSISEAVSMTRNKVKNGRLLLQHNIQYGFLRNLIGGSYVAFALSLVDFITFHWFAPNIIALITSVVFIAFYGALMLFGKYIITRQGYNYARVLYQEFLGS